VGGAIMIALLGLVGPRVLGGRTADRARAQVEASDAAPGSHGHDHGHGAQAGSAGRARWGDAARYMISDLTMIRRELVIGFLVAGFLTALVPAAVWQSLFATGHGFWSSLENVLVGPFLAIISFVCSVGNVPLAAALWQGGASFGGVVAFVFADLIALPLLAIYRGYFGLRVTARILAVFWATMSVAGLAVEYLFRWVGVPEPARRAAAAGSVFGWNHTTWLNIAALALFAVMLVLARSGASSGRYAKDPVCGMQVEIAHAPARRERDGETYYFCSDRCARRFDAGGAPHSDERNPMTETMSHDPNGTHRDPVCGMRVNPDTAAASAEFEGETYYFCSPGCRTAFELKPEAFLASR
jgi:YHS domain-containing protein